MLVVAGLVVVADQLRSRTKHQDIVSNSALSTPVVAVAPATSSASSGFKDGTFTATSDYYVPHGQEQIRVDLTLKDGTITDAAIQNSASNSDSSFFQQDFADAYKSYVVGKKISDLRMQVIAGASETSQGFKDALSQIANEAKA